MLLCVQGLLLMPLYWHWYCVQDWITATALAVQRRLCGRVRTAHRVSMQNIGRCSSVEMPAYAHACLPTLYGLASQQSLTATDTTS
jgi:hypothetical protein